MREGRVWWACVAFSCLGAGDPTTLAIKGARVVPVSGPVLDTGTVILEKGLIKAVGMDLPIHPEARVIEGKGLTVYPGFFDGPTELGLAPAGPGVSAPQGATPGPRRGAAAAVELVPPRGPEARPSATPWVNPALDLKVDDPRFATWRQAGITSVLTAPRTGILPGQAALVATAGSGPGTWVLKPNVALNVVLSPIRGGFPSSLMGVVAYLDQLFLDMGRHGAVRTAYDHAPKGQVRPPYDPVIQTLVEAQAAERPLLLPATTPLQIQRALDLARRGGFKALITGAQQAYEAPDLLRGQRVLVEVKWPERDPEKAPEDEDTLQELRIRDRAPTTPQVLLQAGATVAFTSGGKGPGDLVKGARRAVEVGLAKEAALRAMTLAPAEFYGVADRLGSLEPGKIANLVVTDGDLFEAKTKVKFVFVDGVRFEGPSEPAAGTGKEGKRP